jgi:class 3 adenylate cyclase
MFPMEIGSLGRRAVLLRWEWRLAASPAMLWPLVSDTNRMNRLAKMDPVRFVETPDPAGGAIRTGHAKQVGLPVRWEEHPFEWHYGERFSVLRTFHTGPLRAYRSEVALQPDGAGTLLVHSVEILPRTPLLNAIARLEGRSLQKRWGAAYRAVDAYLTGEAPYPLSHLEDSPVPTALVPAVRGMEGEGCPPRQISRLVAHLLNADEVELLHIRPFALADTWRESRISILELCLRASQHGLLKPRWSLLCPHCRGPKLAVTRLLDLKGHAYCPSCSIDYDGSFDEATELAFRPDPEVRPVSGMTYCVGGPGATPHILFQGRVPAGETVFLNLDVMPGTYRLRGPRVMGKAYVLFAGQTEGPQRSGFATVSRHALSGPAEALAGPRLSMQIKNEDVMDLQVVLELSNRRDDVATAGYVTAFSRFRAFLASEVLSEGVQLPVGMMAFLTVTLADAKRLRDDLGDEEARDAAEAAFTLVAERVGTLGGTVFKREGDALTSAFFDPLDCVRAGLGVLGAVRADPRFADVLQFKVGADAGACHARTEGGQIAYAGQAVSHSATSAQLARGDDLAVTRALASEVGVELYLSQNQDWASEPIRATGEAPEAARYFRIRPVPEAAAV